QELLTDDPRGLPTLGSAVGYALGRRAYVLPYVALPYTLYNVVQLPGQAPGLLGGAYERFQVEGDPNAVNFRIPTLERRGGPAPPEPPRGRGGATRPPARPCGPAWPPPPRPARGRAPRLAVSVPGGGPRPGRWGGCSTWRASRTACAGATAGTASAKACCWPA